jgi:GTP-binding protein
MNTEETNNYRIIDANFKISSPTFKLTPAEEKDLPEIVFLGRSNVGKSSLLNSLTNRKNLAKSSSTPGKTRLINFFEVIADKEGERYKMRFVDLPGFGYAKVSKAEKKDWETNLTEYLLKRSAIKLFIQLIDSRHENLKNDQEVTQFLESVKRPEQTIVKVFTKTDKIKQNEIAKKRNENPGAFFVTNLKKKGIDQLRNHICGLLF